MSSGHAGMSPGFMNVMDSERDYDVFRGKITGI